LLQRKDLFKQFLIPVCHISLYSLLTFSPREKENFSPIIFFIHKIRKKVIIVLVCVTYNIQCMKVTFLTVNIKLFLQWLLSSKGYQFSISRFSNSNLLYIYFSEHCLFSMFSWYTGNVFTFCSGTGNDALLF
jgi:hypothetical protein